MTREERNKDYRDNFNQYVKDLMKFSDEILENKLDTIRLQIELAIKNKDEEVYETLTLWEHHIIEARILRSELPENEIEPYINEIELAIAENKREAKQYAERNKVIENKITITGHEEEDVQSSFKVHKARIKEEDDNQMSLF